MELEEIARAIGAGTVLMGNIEAADIENLEPAAFERKVAAALRVAESAGLRGFVLHPSACPYGRTITPRTLANYRIMIRMATGREAAGQEPTGHEAMGQVPEVRT